MGTLIIFRGHLVWKGCWIAIQAKAIIFIDAHQNYKKKNAWKQANYFFKPFTFTIKISQSEKMVVAEFFRLRATKLQSATLDIIMWSHNNTASISRKYWLPSKRTRIAIWINGGLFSISKSWIFVFILQVFIDIRVLFPTCETASI